MQAEPEGQTLPHDLEQERLDKHPRKLPCWSLVLLAALAVGSVLLGFQYLAVGPGVSQTATAALEDLVYPSITLAKYDALETGMNYDQCVAILGDDGTDTSVSDDKGKYHMHFEWQNADGTSLTASFGEDGLLAQKHQSGLR